MHQTFLHLAQFTELYNWFYTLEVGKITQKWGKRMKKMFLSFLAVLLFLPTLLSAPAQAASNNSVPQESEYTFEDVLALEPYISVNNGLFKMDTSSAQKDGHDKELIKMQKYYLNDINKEIKNGKLKAESNLEIINLEEPVIEQGTGDFSVMATCPGKNTSLAYHWWGVSRYMNNCTAIKFAGDLGSVSAGYAGAGAVAALWFPGVAVAGGVISAYAALMSSRVSANNYGSGVYIGITYAGFFNVKPQ